jgi:NADPH:quinone reductase-like Zn-dependent oxidoreductase
MLALVANGKGDAELREVDDPVPRDDEAVVAVRASSLNRGEVRGLASAAPGTISGWDVAGEVVVAAANRSGPPIGTRVVGLVRSGAWAQRVAVPTHALARLPDSVSYETAATLPVAGITAWRALQVEDVIDRAKVLITGAAGGVGRFAIQLAMQQGAYVTAVVGSDARKEGLLQLGAEEVVVGMPDEGAFDLILDSVGGASLSRALDLVARRGTIVSYGASDPSPTTFSPGPFFRKGGARLYGLIVFEEVSYHRSAALDLATLLERIEHGALRVDVDLVTSWREPQLAFKALMERKVKGKAVLVFDDHSS